MNYTEFYRTNYQNMVAYARTFVTADCAEDAVQDALLSLLEHGDDPDDCRNFMAYAMQTVRNRCFDIWRKKQYMKRHEVALTQEELIRTCSVVNNNVLRWMDRVEVEYRTNMAVNVMSRRCRAVFNMRVFKDMAQKDVADTLGIAESTVESQMRIALRTLRRSFAV